MNHWWEGISGFFSNVGNADATMATIVAVVAVAVSLLAVLVSNVNSGVGRRVALGEKRPYLMVANPSCGLDPSGIGATLRFKVANIGPTPAVYVCVRTEAWWVISAAQGRSAVQNEAWFPVIRPGEDVSVELKLTGGTQVAADSVAQILLRLQYRDFFREKHRDMQRLDLPLMGRPTASAVGWRERLRHFRRV